MNNRVSNLPFKFIMGSITYFVITITIAMILYNNYNFYEQYLSALGVGPTGILFNPSLILLGIAMFWFYWELYKISNTEYGNKIINFTVLSLGCISGLLLIGIGLFISDGETSDIHDLFAILFFLLRIPLYLSVPRLINSFSDLNLPSYFKILSYLISISTIIALLIPMVNQHVFQKIIVGLELAFLFMLSYRLLTSKTDFHTPDQLN